MTPRVYGHPRSGNHALADFIYRNWFSHRSDLAATVRGVAVGHPDRRKSSEPCSFTYDGRQFASPATMPYAALLADHRLPTARLRPGSVYVVRDGRDVALSVFHWKRMLSVNDERLSLTELLEAPRPWGRVFGTRDDRSCTLFEHWMAHVTAWAVSDQPLVRYEELLSRPAVVAQHIARWFDLPDVPNPKLPAPVGWNAGTNFKVSRWRSELPSRALALFDSVVPVDFVGRWEK